MSIDQHIENKIAAASEDEEVALALSATADMLREMKVDYAVLGSCGLQSYFDCFYRLPNDLDIVLRAEEIDSVRRLGASRGYDFVEQLGRARLFVEDFPVHLIPHTMNVIDKDTNTVFAKIDLSLQIPDAEYRAMRFINSSVIARMKVFPLEAIFFVELIRPIYTGSVMNVALTVRSFELKKDRILSLIHANPAVRRIIHARLRRYPEAVQQMTILRVEDRLIISERLKALASEFEASLLS